MENTENQIRKAIIKAYEELIENYMQKYEFLLSYSLKTEMYNGGSIIVEIENNLSSIKIAQLRRNFQLLIYPGTMTNFKSRFDLYLNYNAKDALYEIENNGEKLEKILEKIPLLLEGARFLKNKLETPLTDEPKSFNRW